MHIDEREVSVHVSDCPLETYISRLAALRVQRARRPGLALLLLVPWRAGAHLPLGPHPTGPPLRRIGLGLRAGGVRRKVRVGRRVAFA